MDDRPDSNRPTLGDGLRRLLDGRAEQRDESDARTAIVNHRGARHVVRLINVSASGAMIAVADDLVEGDTVMLQLLDHAPVAGQVRWVRDGCAGINFLDRLE